MCMLLMYIVFVYSYKNLYAKYCGALTLIYKQKVIKMQTHFFSTFFKHTHIYTYAAIIITSVCATFCALHITYSSLLFYFRLFINLCCYQHRPLPSANQRGEQ